MWPWGRQMSAEISMASLSSRFRVSLFGTFPSSFSLPPSTPTYSLCSSPPGFQESISFKLIAISLFYNHSCTQNLGSSWLGEFQMQVWDSRFGTFVYLWPLSKGNFSNEELMELQKLFHLYFIRLAHVFHNHVIQWKLKCKFSHLSMGSEDMVGAVYVPH